MWVVGWHRLSVVEASKEIMTEKFDEHSSYHETRFSTSIRLIYVPCHVSTLEPAIVHGRRAIEIVFKNRFQICKKIHQQHAASRDVV